MHPTPRPRGVRASSSGHPGATPPAPSSTKNSGSHGAPARAHVHRPGQGRHHAVHQIPDREPAPESPLKWLVSQDTRLRRVPRLDDSAHHVLQVTVALPALFEGGRKGISIDAGNVEVDQRQHAVVAQAQVLASIALQHVQVLDARAFEVAHDARDLGVQITQRWHMMIAARTRDDQALPTVRHANHVILLYVRINNT